jgi:hypothetical protein
MARPQRLADRAISAEQSTRLIQPPRSCLGLIDGHAKLGKALNPEDLPRDRPTGLWWPATGDPLRRRSTETTIAVEHENRLMRATRRLRHARKLALPSEVPRACA